MDDEGHLRRILYVLKGVRDRGVLGKGAVESGASHSRKIACSSGAKDDIGIDERSVSGSLAGPSGHAGGHSGQNGHAMGRAAGMPAQRSALPMLASACPGWVCYAEKTHGDLVLPFISTARSPQVLC